MPSGIAAADWISHHARYTPSAEAAHDLASQRRFSYAQLDERVSRAALWLGTVFRVARGDRVAVLSRNDTDVFELQFACRRLGAIFVPHGERPELKSGMAGLYKLLGLPVIPVALDSGLYSPKGSFVKRAGMVRMKVGEAIPPGLPRAEIEARVFAAINALNG